MQAMCESFLKSEFVVHCVEWEGNNLRLGKSHLPGLPNRLLHDTIQTQTHTHACNMSLPYSMSELICRVSVGLVYGSMLVNIQSKAVQASN